MIEQTVQTYKVQIYIAGDLDDIRRSCKDYVNRVGACVNVIPADYIFTNGSESGARIELLNYPRFPTTPDVLWGNAVALGHQLMEDCYQGSFLVTDHARSVWFSRRKEDTK